MDKSGEAPIIEVKNIGKSYRLSHNDAQDKLRHAITNFIKKPWGVFCGKANTEEFWALRDVSFSVREGEVLGIIGRNGAGKSTLLKLLSQITEPTEGEAVMRGRVASLLEVGTGFHPELTGRENIYMNGSILGMSRREIRGKFDEIVAFAEVEKFLDTPVKRYSSGMYVRLAFAVAAHLEPEILLIDEVLAVGDVAFQKKCLGKMEDVATQGRTVLFVSHNMAAVRQLTTRCILLEGGKLNADGTPVEVTEKYLQNAKDTIKGVYEVKGAKRRSKDLSQIIEFVRVKFDGMEDGMLMAGEKLCVAVTVKGNESVEKFRFSFTLFHVSGAPVGSAFGECIYNVCAGEEKTLRMSFDDLRLAPGVYYFAIAVGKGNESEGYRDFDILHDVLHFQVAAKSGDTDGTISSWRSDWGAIVFPSPASLVEK